MQVNSYIYQSPSSSSVQFGRPDPSTKKETSTGSNLDTSTNETVQKAENFAESQKSEVAPSVDTGNTLDLYA